MSRIDISEWDSFKIGDYFDAKNTGNILAREVEDGSGSTPFVTASGINNGVSALIDAKGYELIEGNCILVGGKTFTLTYQAVSFVSNDSHNFVLRLKQKGVGLYAHLYLLTILRKALSYKYSWDDAVTAEKILQENILLPVDEGKKPDWAYMESYMHNIGDSDVSPKIQVLKNLFASSKLGI